MKIKQIIKNIKNSLRKKETWEKIDITSLIKNKVLLLSVPYNYQQFSQVCKKAEEQKIQFDTILTSYDCYLSLYNNLIQMMPPGLKKGILKTPLTKKGQQTLEGITNPQTKKVIQIFTVKPEKYKKVN